MGPSSKKPLPEKEEKGKDKEEKGKDKEEQGKDKAAEGSDKTAEEEKPKETDTDQVCQRGYLKLK